MKGSRRAEIYSSSCRFSSFWRVHCPSSVFFWSVHAHRKPQKKSCPRVTQILREQGCSNRISRTWSQRPGIQIYVLIYELRDAFTEDYYLLSYVVKEGSINSIRRACAKNQHILIDHLMYSYCQPLYRNSSL